MDLEHVKVQVQCGQHRPCQNHTWVRATRSPGGSAGSDSASHSSGEARSEDPSRDMRRRRCAPGILMTLSAPNFLLLCSLEVP